MCRAWGFRVYTLGHGVDRVHSFQLKARRLRVRFFRVWEGLGSLLLDPKTPKTLNP